jgi:hypothetical protein
MMPAPRRAGHGRPQCASAAEATPGGGEALLAVGASANVWRGEVADERYAEDMKSENMFPATGTSEHFSLAPDSA